MSVNIKFVAAWCALAAVGVLAAQPPEPRWPDARKCELATAGGRLTATAQCGTLEVPEDRAAVDGRSIELAWAVVEARTADPRPDPVVFLAGGPGQSARAIAPLIARALRDINDARDLIFLDQRGTGGSNALECRLAEEVFTIEPGLDEIERQLRECHAGLDAAVEHYTTGDAADDLEALREHLGLEALNLVGGSYGTRLAQVYLRRYPAAVRSVVLDGVVPTRLRLGAEHAVMLDRSIDALIRRCAGTDECNRSFPGLADAFAELKRRYRAGSQTILATHPRTGVAEEIEFDDAVLAASLRFLAYSPESRMIIPYLIHEAATTGSPERLATQALITSEEMGEDIAIGLNFSVGCSEDWPWWPDDDDASGTLLGNAFPELYRRVCAWWPADPVGPAFHQPFDRDVPVLILSGEVDPVTPPVYGEEAAEQYSRSLHLVAPGRGHITMTNPCIGGVVGAFVEAGALDGLDTECTDTLGPEPFFLDLLGPSP